MHHRDYWIMDLHNWITEIYNWSGTSIVVGFFPLVFSHLIYFHTLEAAHYSQQTFGNRIIPDTHLILLPEIIVAQSRTEVYAGWLVRHGPLRRNKVFIDILRNVPFTWRSRDNYDYMYLVCVARKYDDMLWDWMKSRFISPRPARLGLLYLFIVGGQCHTRPLMHVAGVLGCCTPVVKTGQNYKVTFLLIKKLMKYLPIHRNLEFHHSLTNRRHKIQDIMENLIRLVCHSAFSPAEVKWDFEVDESQLLAEIMELETG